MEYFPHNCSPVYNYNWTNVLLYKSLCRRIWNRHRAAYRWWAVRKPPCTRSASTPVRWTRAKFYSTLLGNLSSPNLIKTELVVTRWKFGCRKKNNGIPSLCFIFSMNFDWASDLRIRLQEKKAMEFRLFALFFQWISIKTRNTEESSIFIPVTEVVRFSRSMWERGKQMGRMWLPNTTLVFRVNRAMSLV